MRKFKTPVLLLVIIAAIYMISGCEESVVTETTKLPDEDIISNTEKWGIDVDLNDNEKALFENRIDKAKQIKQKGLPKEIEYSWENIMEDLKEFFGETELPQREIEPGVYSWIPEEYLEGEKNKKLKDFMSVRIRNLIELYEKHGLRESMQNGVQPYSSTEGYNYDAGSIASLFQQGSSEVHYLFYAWTYSPDCPGAGVDGYTTGPFGKNFSEHGVSYYAEWLDGGTFLASGFTCVYISASHYINFAMVSSSSDMDCIFP